MPLAALKQATVRYANGVVALRDLDCELNAHEFVAVVGSSGCGKSTLLKLVAGLLEPSSGSCARSTQNLGYVFQFPTLLPWRNVTHNIVLPHELGGQPRGDVSGLLQLVGLTDFATSYPNQLSGGMQMRVALARALINKPELLLMDEPFGALDEITRQRLNEELLALWEHDRWAALFVTHNVAEAVFLSQRVLVMTSRPGAIAEEFTVPFPYPRLPALRAQPEFARLTGQISARLREVAA